MTVATLRRLAALAFIGTATPVAAMDMKVVGDQLIMSGHVDGNELVKLRDVVADHGDRTINTVILRDSPGGDLWTATRVGEYIRDKGWRTAVSGHCFSACALMFLGGAERHFTDDKPALLTQIAFHAAYHTADGLRSARGSNNPAASHRARVWAKALSGGKLSDAMLDQFEKLDKTEFIHFFDARRMPRAGQPSVFLCSHAISDPKQKCRPIPGTDAYAEGVVTTPVLLRSNDLPMRSGPKDASDTRDPAK